MMSLDDFFVQREIPLHPLLRNWKQRLQEPNTSAVLEIYRPTQEFGVSPVEICLQFVTNGNRLPLEREPWDGDLNTGLIQLKVKAVSPEQEAERFMLGLRDAFRKAERDFGDGYFNAVLVDLLTDSDLRQDPQIDRILRHAPALRPARMSKYDECRQMIADAIAGRAQELAGPLEYPREDAKRILVTALALYLDERFSVSSRRRMGLL